MKKLLAVLSLALVCFFATGCFQIEQSIELKKDLSGTAAFHLGVDLEPMVMIMAQVGREMEGKKGPMTAAELAKAKADFKKQSAEKKSSDQPSRADIEKNLPKGVKLLDFAVKELDFGVVTDVKFAFDKIHSLIAVKMPSKGDGDPTKKNVIDSPFEGLELIEKGDTITLQTKPMNPTESVKEQASETGAPKLDPATEKMVKDAFDKMHVIYRIKAPFTIVSNNATRREGDTLIWEYDMKRFEQMSKSKKPEDMGVKVTYKR